MSGIDALALSLTNGGRALNACFELPVSPAQRFIMIAIGSRVDFTKSFTRFHATSLSRLEKYPGYSRRCIIDNLASLVNDGWLAKQKGRVVSVETRAKHAAAQIGRQHSPEVRAKISASKKGQTPSAEHMERLRAIATGRTVSESTRAAIGAANSGRKKSPEEIAHRQATRAANRSV